VLGGARGEFRDGAARGERAGGDGGHIEVKRERGSGDCERRDLKVYPQCLTRALLEARAESRLIIVCRLHMLLEKASIVSYANRGCLECAETRGRGGETKRAPSVGWSRRETRRRDAREKTASFDRLI
jgi:hypothetical protein